MESTKGLRNGPARGNILNLAMSNKGVYEKFSSAFRSAVNTSMLLLRHAPELCPPSLPSLNLIAFADAGGYFSSNVRHAGCKMPPRRYPSLSLVVYFPLSSCEIFPARQALLEQLDSARSRENQRSNHIRAIRRSITRESLNQSSHLLSASLPVRASYRVLTSFSLSLSLSLSLD